MQVPDKDPIIMPIILSILIPSEELIALSPSIVVGCILGLNVGILEVKDADVLDKVGVIVVLTTEGIKARAERLD